MKSNIILFWANWDLSKKKLIPSIYKIIEEWNNWEINIVWIWRRDFNNESFRKYIKNIKYFENIENNKVNSFLNNLNYFKLDINIEKDYLELWKYLNKNNLDQNIVYLSISPEHINSFLKNYKLLWLDEKTKIIFEKPFWFDLKSAEELEKKINNVLKEEQVYIIDHYVWKEPIQNILALRFSNIIFEPIWNNKYIDNIQIIASEDIWIWDRWEYYEKSWAIKDMLQNHLFQMMALITMEAPVSLNSKSIWYEKLKVLKSIEIKDLFNNIVLWQYNWYKNEIWVDKNSKTETFVAINLEISNFRFKWVPIYLKTWKYLDKKYTKIIITFKEIPWLLYWEFNKIESNRIIIEVQPNEAIDIHFNIKENGDSKKVNMVKSKFENISNSKEAYEKLIEDVIKWDKTLFTSYDFLKESWRIVDKIVNCKNNCPNLFNYDKWSKWPIESDLLLNKNWRQWYY